MDSSIENILSDKEAEEKIDFRAYFIKLLSYWWLFAISVFISLIIGYIYIKTSPPIYLISAKILVEDEKKGGGNLDPSDLLGDMGGFLNAKSNVDNEVEVLRTHSLARRVVEKLHLNIHYYTGGAFGEKEIYRAPFVVELIQEADSIKNAAFKFVQGPGESFTLLYKDAYDEEISINSTYNRPILIKDVGVLQLKRTGHINAGKEFSINILSEEMAAISLKKQLRVAVTNKQVTTIDIKIEHTIPQLGEDILRTLVDSYMEESVTEKNKIVESTINFIDSRLELVSKELGDIEGGMQTFKQENELANISEQSRLLVENSSELSKQATSFETQISVIEALEDYLRDESKNKRVMPNSVMPQDLGFTSLVESYNQLLQERDKMLMSSTEESPYIKNLDERISGVRSAMLKNLNGTKKTVQISLSELQKKIALLESHIRQVPAHERTYLGMFRQQTLKQEIYLFLLKKREETALTKTTNVASSKVIDPPKSETRPHSPQKGIILIISLALGALIPIVIIYFIDFWNDKVQSKEDIAKATSIPVIGEISENDSKDNFIHGNLKSVFSEQFRGLRTNIAFFLNSSQTGHTILLTSSVTGEGKTFTSVNLGTILALSGKNVVLIDLDLRKGSLSAQLGLKGKHGFTNFIIDNDAKTDDLILPSGFCDSLYILPSGPYPPNPAETLMHERTELLIRSLQKKYDYIIMDAPPVGMVTDAQLLDKLSSITLYLVRYNYTLKSYLDIAEDLNRNHKMKRMGIIFNGVKNKGSQYVYGRYGHNETKPTKLKWLDTIRKKLNTRQS